jgi:hypothetical protein
MERKPDEAKSICDKCCEILQRTDDGDLLEPWHLKLIECAANNSLNEKGLKALDELYKDVTEGSYVKPFLHGIPGITRDHEGYIYWKDIRIEHYSNWYVNSICARNHLLDLAKRCEFLESRGIEVGCGSAVLCFEGDIANEYGAMRLNELKSLYENDKYSIAYSKVCVTREGRSFDFISIGIDENLEDIKAHEVTQELNNTSRGLSDICAVTVQAYIYGDGETLFCDDSHKRKMVEALNYCHKYMSETGLIKMIQEIKAEFKPN